MPEYVYITGRAESVSQAIESRHSIRQFSQDPVPAAVLEEILQTALRTPSWKNSQPWQIHAVSGARQQKLSEELKQAARAGIDPEPDAAWPENYPSDVRKRMFDLGMKLYGVAGIDRKDKAAREAFALRNFEFFDAPVVLFIFSPVPLSFWIGLDQGCLLQSIMLLAREKGLGSCPQAALSSYPDIVRKALGVENMQLVCGMSLGYPVEDSDLNRFHSPRLPAKQAIQYHE